MKWMKKKRTIRLANFEKFEGIELKTKYVDGGFEVYLIVNYSEKKIGVNYGS